MKCPKCNKDLIKKQVNQSLGEYFDHYDSFRCLSCIFSYMIYNPINDKKCSNINIIYHIRFKGKYIESVKFHDEMGGMTRLCQIMPCVSAEIVRINQFSEPEDYEDIKSYEKILERLMKLVVFS